MKTPLRRQAAFLAALLLTLAAAVQGRPVRLDNGDIYEGGTVDGMRTGKGLYVWANGNRYEGDFLANQMHGQGLFAWSNGDRYQGGFAHGQRSGQGRFEWRSGAIYEGGFENGELHGHGVFTAPDGSSYEGSFLRGARTGQGGFTWPDRSRYYGNFLNGGRHGLGVFHWRDGTVYRGQFQNDRMHGYGVKTQPEGVKELQHWRDGILLSNAPLVEDERCRLRLEGRAWMFRSHSCINGLAHGRGLATSLDGELIVTDGRFVLGNLVEGEIKTIWFEIL